MKKRIVLIIFIMCILITLVSVTISADEEDAVLVIDAMSSDFGWNSDSLAISYVSYTDETASMSSSNVDFGYLCFERAEADASDEHSVHKHFDEPLNLYKYSAISFNYRIPETESADNVTYTLTVTLGSESLSFVSAFAAETGEWATAEISLDSWYKRSAIDDIKITLSPTFDSAVSEAPEKLDICFYIDGITARSAADTKYEDNFMTPSFSVSDGIITNYMNGIVRWRRASYSSISANISYSEPSEAAGHNALRVVLSVDTDTELHFTALYKDGTVYESKSQTVSVESALTACYFSFPSPEKALQFTLMSDTALGGTVLLYGIDTVYMPVSESVTALGTLDVCELNENGALNLRGTISSDTVAEHIKESICIYAIPLYETLESVIADSEPIAKATMTTRFNITVDASALPDGASAMKYAVVIYDKTSPVSVCEPRVPETKKAGVTVPSESDSIKGITSADINHEAGLTEIPLDLGSIFGSPSSSKIYSAFGELYYFDSDIISELDFAVKSVSLSGTKVYLRLTQTDENGEASLISVTDTESFRELYAVVDFLTSRYSSDSYGYVSGIIIGSAVTDASEITSDSKKLEGLVTAATVISGAGGKNIAAFKVLFPIDNEFITVSPSLSSAEYALRLIARYAAESGLSDYGVIWQTDSIDSSETKYGIDLLDATAKYASSLNGNSPQFYFVKYAPAALEYTASPLLVKDFISAYFSACEQSSILGFILDTQGLEHISSEYAFSSIFAKIDTDIYTTAVSELYSSAEEIPQPKSTAKKRAFTRTVSSVNVKTSLNTAGSLAIFDYDDSFNTGGWFSLSRFGECMTVKAENGRVLRCTGGIMFSSINSPLDLSSAPVLSFELYGDTSAFYTVTIISSHSVSSADFTVSEFAERVYIELSDFDGLSDVTGIIITPKNEDFDSLYIKNICVHSYDLTDAELSELFNTASGENGSENAVPEENIVELLAVISAVTIVSALALMLLRNKEKNESETDTDD